RLLLAAELAIKRLCLDPFAVDLAEEHASQSVRAFLHVRAHVRIEVRLDLADLRRRADALTRGDVERLICAAHQRAPVLVDGRLETGLVLTGHGVDLLLEERLDLAAGLLVDRRLLRDGRGAGAGRRRGRGRARNGDRPHGEADEEALHYASISAGDGGTANRRRSRPSRSASRRAPLASQRVMRRTLRSRCSR